MTSAGDVTATLTSQHVKGASSSQKPGQVRSLNPVKPVGAEQGT